MSINDFNCDSTANQTAVAAVIDHEWAPNNVTVDIRWNISNE